MTRLFFLLFVFSLTVNVLSAQTTYFTVQKTSSNTTKFDLGAKLVKLNLEKACLRNPFISVVDRDLIDFAEEEREIQKNESFMDGTYVEQDKAIGASLIILSSYEADGRDLTIDLVDVETNELIFREIYDLKSFVYDTHAVKREAYFGRYIEEMMEKILQKLKISKQLEINIAKLSEADKSKAKRVLIHCPDECHLTEGQELDVYTENRLENLDIVEKVVVGKVIIENVENTKVSKAKVKDGHKEIFSIFNAGTQLKCQNVSN